MMNYGFKCTEAMHISFRLAQDEVKGIRAIEESLRMEHEHDGTSGILSEFFVEACKSVAMGLVHWRYLNTLNYNHDFV
jgi:hypothetical protein